MSTGITPPDPPMCSAVKHLPDHLAADAAAQAVELNPANRPSTHGLAMISRAPVKSELRIAMTTKWWGPAGVNLTVGFLDGAPADLQARILSHANAWGKKANVKFVLSNVNPQVRITRTPGDGYYSYLGTDILTVPADQNTMNLDNFTMETEDSEFFRVVRHEFGHTLGCPHEHMRADIVAMIDPVKAVRYFRATQGWSKSEVQQQVLTPLDQSEIVLQTPGAEQDSIMCYQLPGSIMKNGKPVIGGTDITDDDYDLVGLLYPAYMI